MEIVKEVAEKMGESPNGVRMILSKADVYVKKSEGASPKKASGAKEGTTTRVSKEAAHAQLVEAIQARDGEVDLEIISKLTGKAALYLAGVISA
jgi:hypothetical protein